MSEIQVNNSEMPSEKSDSLTEFRQQIIDVTGIHLAFSGDDPMDCVRILRTVAELIETEQRKLDAPRKE